MPADIVFFFACMWNRSGGGRGGPMASAECEKRLGRWSVCLHSGSWIMQMIHAWLIDCSSSLVLRRARRTLVSLNVLCCRRANFCMSRVLPKQKQQSKRLSANVVLLCSSQETDPGPIASVWSLIQCNWIHECLSWKVARRVDTWHWNHSRGLQSRMKTASTRS